MIRLQLHISLTIPLLLLIWLNPIQAKPFGSFSNNRRNVPTNLLASVSFDDDLEEIFPIASSKRKSLDWQATSESLVKSVVAVLFARVLLFLTGNKRNELSEHSTAAASDESTIYSTSLPPPLPQSAEWQEMIERVNYLQATLHDYYELWKHQIEQHDNGTNTGWITCMEVSEQNAHLIQELNAKLEDLRKQIQGYAAPPVVEETIVETTTTVVEEESEDAPVSEEQLQE